MYITCIDLFYHNVGMLVPKLDLDVHAVLTCIDLFDHNVGMVCAKVRLRCPCILFVLIYLITMWV